VGERDARSRWLATLAGLIGLAATYGALAADAPVARVLDETIALSGLGALPDPDARARVLAAVLVERSGAHFVREHGLAATPGEIAELAAYDREFDRRDREQRTRKLAELDQRIAAPDLPQDELARLTTFRDTLRRLAAWDALRDAGDASLAPADDAVRAVWVEHWKLLAALYRRYGGVVGLSRAGPYPHGARAALVADYERRGLIEFLDPQLRSIALRTLAEPPEVTLAGSPDFTPYWKRPIVGSYFPDDVPAR